MEEYVNKLVDNTFKNYEFEQAKKIIADKILWYEMKCLNSVDKDKIRELQQEIHIELDKNAITRGYQLIIDDKFKKLLEESEI